MIGLKKIIIEEKRATVQPASDIFVVKGTTGRDDGFKALLDLMGNQGLFFYKLKVRDKTQGLEGLISYDDVVIVKVNSQWDERGGTNTDLVKAIVEAILTHPDGFEGEVVVADNGQARFGAHGYGGSFDYDRNNAEDLTQSVQDVVDAFLDTRVSTYLWDRITTRRVEEYVEGDIDDGYVVDQTANRVTGIRVSYPKFRTKLGTQVSFKHGIWDPEEKDYNNEGLKVINVPVLKSHFICGVTACVKHYMGVASDQLTERSAHYSVGKGGMGTEMAETRMPTLNVLDAIWINSQPGKGPRTAYQEATRLNLILSSVDPVALDSWAAKHVLMQAARLKGYKDLKEVDPENIESGSFGNWLRISMEEIRKAGYEVRVEEDGMNIYTVDLRRSKNP